MNFEELHIGTDCNCLADAIDPEDNTYVRKLSRAKIKPNDFISKWEKGNRPEIENCTQVCLYKGLSINLYSEENRAEILEVYISKFQIRDKIKFSPKSKHRACLFKLAEDAGLIKPTPTDFDKTHQTFFKSDEFEINKVEEIEYIDLKDCV